MQYNDAPPWSAVERLYTDTTSCTRGCCSLLPSGDGSCGRGEDSDQVDDEEEEDEEDDLDDGNGADVWDWTAMDSSRGAGHCPCLFPGSFSCKLLQLHD